MVEQPTKQSGRESLAEPLAQRFASLESELSRLTDFLSEQSQQRSKRRRRITIRFLLCTMAICAGAFAWFSSVYHRSQRQASAVDQLIAQGAFVSYEPRENLAVSLLPGSPAEPPPVVAKSLGVDFFRAATNVSTNTVTSNQMDKKAVIQAISELADLERLRLSHLALTTADLSPLARLSQLQSLDINRARMDNGSLPWLQDTQLRWLDASHTLLGDRLMHDVSRCPDLQFLNMERTTVTDAGLQHLYSMKQLRYLNLKRCPASRGAVIKLSKAIPNCVIDYEPLIMTRQGNVRSFAGTRTQIRLGTPAPVDPRETKLAIPPTDAYQSTYQLQPFQSPTQPYPMRVYQTVPPVSSSPRRVPSLPARRSFQSPVTVPTFAR